MEVGTRCSAVWLSVRAWALGPDCLDSSPALLPRDWNHIYALRDVGFLVCCLRVVTVPLCQASVRIKRSVVHALRYARQRSQTLSAVIFGYHCLDF